MLAGREVGRQSAAVPAVSDRPGRPDQPPGDVSLPQVLGRGRGIEGPPERACPVGPVQRVGAVLAGGKRGGPGGDPRPRGADEGGDQNQTQRADAGLQRERPPSGEIPRAAMRDRSRDIDRRCEKREGITTGVPKRTWNRVSGTAERSGGAR